MISIAALIAAGLGDLNCMCLPMHACAKRAEQPKRKITESLITPLGNVGTLAGGVCVCRAGPIPQVYSVWIGD